MVEQSLAQKVNKMEVNIKTRHVTCGVSHDFNPEGHGISGLRVEQSLKVTILHTLFTVLF